MMVDKVIVNGRPVEDILLGMLAAIVSCGSPLAQEYLLAFAACALIRQFSILSRKLLSFP
jgi:hypothetical protein